MSDDGNISYQPTDGLCYDPKEPKYWDEAALAKEIERVFEVCHGCRMCFKYCDSFPDLFKFIDEEHDGDVRKLTDDQVQHVMDGCFQCKLCEVQCPYTPAENHDFQVDFPKLVHRYDAVHYKKKGGKLRDALLAHPDRSGKLARLSFGMANVMNRVSAHRWMMEKILGIHRDKLLPDFASRTFEAWAKKNDRLTDEPGGEVLLFQTCYVQNNEPQIGVDTLEVMDRNGIDCKCTGGLGCCGMPAWEHGDLDLLQKRAKDLLAKLAPWAEKGVKITALSPTCSMMLRVEYPELVAPEDKERAELVAKHIADPGEILWEIRKEERFNTDFRERPEMIAYHAPCHQRAQRAGFKGRDAARKMLGAKVDTVMECCGHDGTWAMTTEGFEASQRVGKRSFHGMTESDAKVWVTDCPLAALQFEQHAGVKAVHPMTLLAESYRGNALVKKEDG